MFSAVVTATLVVQVPFATPYKVAYERALLGERIVLIVKPDQIKKMPVIPTRPYWLKLQCIDAPLAPGVYDLWMDNGVVKMKAYDCSGGS